MRDRLTELRGAGQEADVIQQTVALEIGDGAEEDEMAHMRGFFKNVEDIKTAIATIKSKVQDVDSFHSKALTSVTGDGEDHQRKLDELMESTNEYIQTTRQKLKDLESENKSMGAENNKPNLTAEQRIRLSQHTNLTKKFMEVILEFQELQKRYKTKYRDRLERQYKIVKPNASSDEIEKAMETGVDGSAGVFAQQILMGPQHAEAKRALYDIQERHQDIVRIEKSILELHQLFLDMAVLVDAQGDMINQIEHYVISAVDHTNKGVDQMKKAVKSQRKSRKKMCCLLFCLLFLIALVSILATVLTR